MKVQLTPLDPWIGHKIGCQTELTPQAIEAYQQEKLAETLHWVRTKSRFYQRHLMHAPQSLSSLKELQALPFTTEQDLRTQGLQLACVSQNEIQRIVTLQTSGTTGDPKRICFTAGDQELTVDFFGVGMSTLTEIGERVLILLPGQTPGSVGDLLRLGLARCGRIPVPYGPVRDPLHALEAMQTQQADCLVGSPTQVLGLARRWQPGRKAPRTVLLSTDYVPAAIVRALEDAWGCKVFNHYGTTEMGLGGGVECEAQRGYHLREADLYFEIVDPIRGEWVAEGEYGEVVFTTLTRQGMPLIRYRTGDRSRWVPGECPCGTTLRTMERVSGRFGGFVPLAGGTLRLADFDEALFSIPTVLNFSVTLTDTALHIEAQVLTQEDATAQVERAVETIPAIQNQKVTVHCAQNTGEAGSLQKRMLIDQRG